MNKPKKSNTKIQTSKKTNYHWIKIEIDVMNKNVGKKKKKNQMSIFLSISIDEI